MKKEIRIENLYLLMASLEEGTVTKLAKKTGISRVTLSKIVHGGSFTARMARQIETTFKKPFGWMDINHDGEIAPLYDKTVLQAAIACLYSAKGITELYEQLSVKGKAQFMDKLYMLFTDPAARKLAPHTLLTMLGVVDYEGKDTSQTSGTKANPEKT